MNSTDYIYCVFGNNDFVKVFLIKNILKNFNLILILIYQKTKINFNFFLNIHLLSSINSRLNWIFT